MMLRVDPGLALPVYEQIREQVVRMVVAGTLIPGDRLPTIRQLANDLGLAKGTVAKAYTLLEEERVVESRGHRGTYIAQPTVIDTTAAELGEQLATAAEAFVISAVQLGVERDDAIATVVASWDSL